MTAAPTLEAGERPPPAPQLRLRGRSIPIVLPKRHDPRLKLSAIIITLTVLGMTVLDFKLSIPQVAVSVLLAAAIETSVTYRREHVLVWPASAIQTGISVAFIFRVGGTSSDDVWSVRGLHLFAFVIVLSLLPKYLLRYDGRHVFNPSNVGIVWGLLLIGPSYVFSEHLWWGPLGTPVLASMVVIVVGAFWLLRQVRMLELAAAFLVPFLAIVALFAVSGRSYYALWHDGPVAGSFYWLTIALSPELLIFVFFMITDPQTAPKSRRGRIIFAVLTAVVCAGLILPQTTEFAIKVAILSSLVLTCALVPLIERLSHRIGPGRQGVEASETLVPRPLGRRLAGVVRRPVLVAVIIIAVAAPMNTLRLAGDDGIELIERNLTTRVVQ